jgi:ABC-type antimicrobial peptide transport system permease subunit
MRLSNSFLFLLSTLLVYNFLTIQLEEKQAEISTMRLLGMTQLRVISSIVNSSIKVLLPAIIVGVILSIPMQEWINERFLKNPNLSITSLFYNMAWGGFFGTLIPVLASLIPGYNLIQLTLRDLLDHSKSKTKAL